MTHPHLKIKDSWSSYKFYVKDLIYQFTQDGIYREQKVKWGSLYKLFIAKNTPVGLTTNFEYLDVIDRDYFYNPNNSFKSLTISTPNVPVRSRPRSLFFKKLLMSNISGFSKKSLPRKSSLKYTTIPSV